MSSYADVQKSYYKRARERERSYFDQGTSDTVFTIRNAAAVAKKARLAITNIPKKADMPGDIEYDYLRSSRRKGRNKKLTLRRLAQLSRIGRQSIVVRYQSAYEAWTPQDDGFGAGKTSYGRNKLFHHLNTTANGGNGELWLPMHVYDVTSFGNYQGAAFGWETPQVGQAIIGNTSGFDLLFKPPVAGTNPDGTNTGSTLWQPENVFAPLTSTDNSPWRSSLLRWVDIKLLLYGRRDYPTRFRISLIQIPDDVVNWGTEGYTSSEPVAVQHVQNVMQPFLVNPVLSGNSRNGVTKWKTLMFEDFVLHADNANNGTSCNNTKLVKFFWRANRIQRYDWRDGDRLRADALGDGTAPGALGKAGDIGANIDWIQTATDMQRTVHPKARVYLVIQSMATYTTGTGDPAPFQAVGDTEFSWTNVPAYDICMRVKHEINP